MCLTAPTKAGKLLQAVFKLVRSGELKAVKPTMVFDYSNIEQAFRTVQEDQTDGKVVLRLTEESMVPALLHNTNPLKLNPNVTYVLAGGLGGIGRALAIYLADHGARYLAFLSRTGRLLPQAQEVLDQLRRRDLHAAVYACDITDQEKLKETILKMQTEMPRIKGVIQAAMVLRDGLFESMSYENWVQATRPKIDGSWNLHETMPKDLDFFVMLSSISGIMGNRGQSNYCAGNTYQDALAHHRRSLGLTAHTIDLGAVREMGWLEENDAGPALATMMAGLAISKEQFFQIIKGALTGYSQGSHRMPTQVVAGIGTGVSGLPSLKCFCLLTIRLPGPQQCQPRSRRYLRILLAQRLRPLLLPPPPRRRTHRPNPPRRLDPRPQILPIRRHHAAASDRPRHLSALHQARDVHDHRRGRDRRGPPGLELRGRLARGGRDAHLVLPGAEGRGRRLRAPRRDADRGAREDGGREVEVDGPGDRK